MVDHKTGFENTGYKQCFQTRTGPGMGSVLVEAKTSLGIGPARPG